METVNHPKYINEILKMPLWTFSISFGLGTLILLLYLVDKNRTEYVFIIGFFYVLAAIVLNFAMLLLLIVCAIINKEYRLQILERTSLILINIPIAILYFFIVIEIN